jgi:hypothetical protein
MASLDERLADLDVWFKENESRGRDYDLQQKFLQTAIRVLIHRLREVHAEQQRTNGRGDIVLPRLVGRL